MNAINACCEECGAFIQAWLSGTPRLCRKCWAPLAAPADAATRQEPISPCESELFLTASTYAYCPKRTRDLVVLLDQKVPPVVAGDECWIFYPGRELCGGEWKAAAQTYTHLKRLASIPRSGVVMIWTLILIDESFEVADPLWREPIKDFVRLGPECLPPQFSIAFCFSTPVTVVPLFGAYLHRRGKEAGNGLAA